MHLIAISTTNQICCYEQEQQRDCHCEADFIQCDRQGNRRHVVQRSGCILSRKLLMHKSPFAGCHRDLMTLTTNSNIYFNKMLAVLSDSERRFDIGDNHVWERRGQAFLEKQNLPCACLAYEYQLLLGTDCSQPWHLLSLLLFLLSVSLLLLLLFSVTVDYHDCNCKYCQLHCCI